MAWWNTYICVEDYRAPFVNSSDYFSRKIWLVIPKIPLQGFWFFDCWKRREIVVCYLINKTWGINGEKCLKWLLIDINYVNNLNCAIFSLSYFIFFSSKGLCLFFFKSDLIEEVLLGYWIQLLVLHQRIFSNLQNSALETHSGEENSILGLQNSKLR